MSLTTHEYDEENSQLKKPNSHRRYILESPIRNSTKHKPQIKIENYSKPKEYVRSNLTKSSFYGINEDPWVNELLERDIDLSKFDQEEEEIQLINIPNINNSKSISQHSQSPFIINDESKRRPDQYQSIYSTQSKFNNLVSFLNKLLFQSKSPISEMDSSTINKFNKKF
jgi:hypothetical protein